MAVGQDGNPAAGQQVFVEVNQNIAGYADQPIQFWGIVPAAA